MFPSMLGKTTIVFAIALGTSPAAAAEIAPLGDGVLGQVTAQGMGGDALLAWLSELGTIESAQSKAPLGRQNQGAVSRIVQTATIDLPPAAGSQANVGGTIRSGGYGVGGGQNATNVAAAATLNGLGIFALSRR